jgi:hypothetical protein
VGRTVLLIDGLSRPPREIPYEIVGVVRDARLSDPREEADPAMYLSMLQAFPSRLRIVVSTAGNPEAPPATTTISASSWFILPPPFPFHHSPLSPSSPIINTLPRTSLTSS